MKTFLTCLALALVGCAIPKNDQRRRDGDWRAVQPAVGPKP